MQAQKNAANTCEVNAEGVPSTHLSKNIGINISDYLIVSGKGMVRMEKIKWGNSGKETRQAVCELCGWNKKTAGRIAKTRWESLSPAAKHVLVLHGIEE